MNEKQDKPTMAEFQLNLIIVLGDFGKRREALKEWLELWDIKTLRMK